MYDLLKGTTNNNIRLLRTAFETNLIAIGVFKAVYNDKGEIQDFCIQIVNRELEIKTGKSNLAGKSCLTEFPGIMQSGLFDIFSQVIKTGQAVHGDYYYGYDGIDKWFASSFVKVGDFVIISGLDITASKQEEKEKFNNYTLLREAEMVAKMGSWQYNLSSEKLTWSEGMYRLFNINRNKHINSDAFLKYCTPKGRLAAARVIQYLKSEKKAFSATLEVINGDDCKMLKVKGKLVYNSAGKPAKFLGVAIDITELKKAQERNRRLTQQRIKYEEEQQMKILQVALNSQEEERKRIAESLHNGLGQILYAVKISLANLDITESEDKFLFKKRYTDHLLIDAIKESRMISHELTPTILEDFGLKEALLDVCSQFQSSINFTCNICTVSVKLEKYMQLALYRILQELILNIAKHSDAKNASILVDTNEAQLIVSVHDDGKGFNANGIRGAGIGLPGIHNKVRLLKGAMEVLSEEGKGTLINITFPLL
jgi:signal transduction histidine kinase